MKPCYFLLFFCFTGKGLFAQDTLAAGDTARVLDEVVIHAYEGMQGKMRTPLPVATIPMAELDRYPPQSVVQAINTIPGVRMEERSPSSYRLNIRGSSMRAPFGVRNVKVYFSDLPYTDPGGTTYLNQLGLLHFAGAEIVKGPGGSMYGAGTGGVVLLQPQEVRATGFNAGYAYGSYGQHHFFANVDWLKAGVTQNLSYQQSISDGYREQSASDKKIVSWNGVYNVGKKVKVQSSFLFGDLHYETPGALTLTEYETDPAGARPAAGSFPSAAAARAAIDQKMVWYGISAETRIAEGLSNKTGVYASYVTLKNPAIRNYAVTLQPHGGFRTVFHLERPLAAALLHINAGAEAQTGTSSIEVSNNNAGIPGALQSSEDIKATQGFVFIQGSLAYREWTLLLGASLNTLSIDYSRRFPSPAISWQRSFGNNIMPRIVLSRELSKSLFAWASFSKGFSPPVTDELLPSGSALNTTLRPEEGTNYEAGLRCSIADHFTAEINIYYFRLNNTIVQRRDAGGGDQYINAGSTRQPGAEAAITYCQEKSGALTYELKASYAYQPYRYASFVKEQDDYSGKALPGLSEHNVYAAFHVEWLHRYLLQANYYYNSVIPLNDANSVYGKASHLVSAKGGIMLPAGKFGFQLYAGVDNLFNQRYSAGYDINAAAGRYYNAAPLRNYFVQLRISR